MTHIVGRIEFDCDIEALSEEIEKAGYVKVVRCKDCKHRPVWNLDDIHGFRWLTTPNEEDQYSKIVCPCLTGEEREDWWMPKDDWFCASGERKENDAT